MQLNVALAGSLIARHNLALCTNTMNLYGFTMHYKASLLELL